MHYILYHPLDIRGFDMKIKTAIIKALCNSFLGECKVPK